MKDWYKQVPPYAGTEPYIYFAFAQPDAGKAWGLLRRLLERGCRIWYCAGGVSGPEELLERQRRSNGAALTLIYLTDAVLEDKNTKSLVLVNQKTERPLLCLDPDRTDRALSMGLRESVPHIPMYEYPNAAELEEALIRAPGFTQEMFGEPVHVKGGSALGRTAAALCLAALLLLAAGYAGPRYLGWFQSEAAIESQMELQDSVAFSDPVIRAAVRKASGGGPITEEGLAAVSALSFETLPESWEELSLLPALERIEMPQTAAMAAEALPEGLTIVLTGGGAA